MTAENSNDAGSAQPENISPPDSASKEPADSPVSDQNQANMPSLQPVDAKADNNPQNAGEAKNAQTDVSQRFALIVEDARIIRRMLVKIFSHAGFQCDEAENGYEGLAMLRKAKSCNYAYSIIATDLMMPEMDGWGFIEQLKARGVFPGVPVVVITAASTMESVRRCMEHGVRHFIVKPFQTEKVLEVVDKALSFGKSNVTK